MPQPPKKQAKKDKLSVIRSFIAGEDVVAELLQAANAMTVTFFETNHNVDGDTILINGKLVTLQEYEQILAQSNFNWVEQKTYSEPLAASMEGDTEEIRGGGIIQPEAANESEINVQSIQARELRNRSKQYLSDKLNEFAKQEKIDLTIREKYLFWMRMQNTL